MLPTDMGRVVLAAATTISVVSIALWRESVRADEPQHAAPTKEVDATDDAPSRALLSDDAVPPPPDPLGPDAILDRWCAPEIDALDNDVCVYTPNKEAPGPRTLVVFLHGVVKPDTSWQWAQQRGAKRAAEAHGFTVIMPRGRIGNGPKGMEDWWTWPTGNTAQAQIENDVIAEWEGARAALEASSGRPFERVWIFGFSNGAYYATSLAVRGRLASDQSSLHANGFAVFAGGSGAPYLDKLAKPQKSRAPLFVAWGGKDPAHGDQEKLASMMRRLSWPSKSEGAKRAGHTMTDKQVTDAVRFLSEAHEKIVSDSRGTVAVVAKPGKKKPSHKPTSKAR